ncbi:MAG: GNAT family N-acetyltransferase [Pseudomonadota bacterium]
MITIRAARVDDGPALMDLLPGLADFPVPNDRNPDDLWRGDAKVVAQHLDGSRDDTLLLVAADEQDRPLGLALVTLRPELLSGAPSAHLEAIVIGPGARGQGAGRSLLEAVEQAAADQGAQSITLHAFRKNERARALYESAGYDGELIRYMKPLAAPQERD